MEVDAASADAGGTELGSQAQIVVERPPPGLARGQYPWPPWGIALLGGGTVAIALAYLAWRALRARRQ